MRYELVQEERGDDWPSWWVVDTEEPKYTPDELGTQHYNIERYIAGFYKEELAVLQCELWNMLDDLVPADMAQQAEESTT